MNKKIVISDIEIEVIKKKIKNMHLYVLPPDGKVRITAPLRVKQEAIRSFAMSKLDWIKHKKAKFKNYPGERKYISGEIHYLWGKPYLLELRQGNKNWVEIMEDRLILTVKATDNGSDSAVENTEDNASSIQKREQILTKWYRQQLKEKLPPLFEKWESIIKVKANCFRVKNMKTRWGTCNVRDKRVWINLKLVKKPIECLEYIIVHELVHLLEKSHNEVFTAYLDNFLPDWRIEKAKLNDNKEINYTYIVECSDGTYYTGWTNNLEKRMKAHNSGKGCKYTHARYPVKLVYYEEFDIKQEAQKREFAIKKLSRKQKEELIQYPIDNNM